MVAPPWTPIPPPLYGGIELVVDQLCRGLMDLGEEIELVTTGDSTCSVPKRWLLEKAEGMRIGMAVPELRHILFAREQFAGFDIVHDHSVAGPVLATVANDDIPVVTTIHGPFNDELIDIYKQTTRKVPLIAISHSQANSTDQVEVSAVIHHGLNANDFPFGSRNGDHLVFLGRMSPDKGAHRAIEVAEATGEKLIIAAKMRERWEVDYFEEFVKPHLSEKIIYEGEVPHERKLEILAGAKAMLFPIRWKEPFGMVMLESLACGTPVIAFKEGAAPEVITDGVSGYLVDGIEEMIDAVGKIGHIDREKCRSEVKDRFSTENMAKAHLDFYKKIIEGQ